MSYRVLILPSAQREHNAVPSPFYEQIEQRMVALGDDPRPPGCKKLKNSEADWRIRVEVYRILYSIDDTRPCVTILAVRHRKDAYR